MRAARLRLFTVLTLMLALVMMGALAGCGASGANGKATPTATPVPPQPTTPSGVPTRDVTFTTPDGVRLSGTLYGNGGKGATGVVLAHQVHAQQSQWMGFAKHLAAHGYLALTFDFRGCGASEGEFDPGAQDVDLQTAMRFLQGQGASRIVLMGASLGGAGALRVAAVEPVAAVATLSAVTSYPEQIVTESTIKAIKAPKLFINSELDPAAEDTQFMYNVAAQPKEIHLYPGNAHGVALFGDQHSVDLTDRLLTFLATYAPAK